MKIESICPRCNKRGVKELSSCNIGKKHFVTLDCGHSYSSALIGTSGVNDITLLDGRKLYPFQVEGVRFLEESNFRALITDEMGLGKTIQAVAGLKLHSAELLPVLVIVKASLTSQWAKEIFLGTGLPCQILSSKDDPFPGIPVYLCSFDSLPPRAIKGSNGNAVSEGLISKIKPLGIKTLIIDECQMMKNHDSNRTQAIRELARATKVVQYDRSELAPRRIETIAKDLMRYHGVSDRYSLVFSKLKPGILGLCESKPSGDGRIVGRIFISSSHAYNDPEDQVIDTILHEIAHAITPGAGHIKLWKDTSLDIGGNGEIYSWCSGTIESNITVPAIEYIIALSGTPIKNNATEYFPILNLLHPERFPNRKAFCDYEVGWYDPGSGYLKPGGLRYPERFQEKTKDFIIRRTRKEVLPDLPSIQRDYKLFSMGEIVEKAYNKKVKALSDFMDESETTGMKSFETQSGVLGYLNLLRHITGLAKIEPTIEYLSEFIESSNGNPEKIVVFHHHIDVGDILETKLEELYPGMALRMKSSHDANTRSEMIEEFRTNEKKRIFIIPTLAGGEGINLQFCSHSIIMEREWNPANEEQAEGRFSRIGSTSDSILVNYPTATGTIDEYFTEIVERKRQYVSEALDGSAPKWQESDIIMELASKVVAKWRTK